MQKISPSTARPHSEDFRKALARAGTSGQSSAATTVGFSIVSKCPRAGEVERIRAAVHGIASSGLTLSKLSVAASLLGDLVKN